MPKPKGKGGKNRRRGKGDGEGKACKVPNSIRGRGLTPCKKANVSLNSKKMVCTLMINYVTMEAYKLDQARSIRK